jgi:hypothetical protein
MRPLDDVVLNAQILEKKFDWRIVVRLDPTDLRGSQYDNCWALGSKEAAHGVAFPQIEFGAASRQQILVSGAL